MLEQTVEWLRQVGVDIAEPTVADILRYLDGVLAMNQRINLTRVTDPSEAARLHVVDSLVCLPEVLASPPGTLVDLGSGGGFPGVPLALVTGRETLLIDSVAKKCAAVSEVLETMNLGRTAACYPGRAERLAVERANFAGAVVARAVAPLGPLLELSAPLLIVGGRLIALKGTPSAEEVVCADKTAELVGMRHVTRRELTLPVGGERRSILVYEKIGRPRVKLPRREGMAQKKPLV